MHFHFDFSANGILFTLTFAALLVLLVVLFGRDRSRSFPWFTAATAIMAIRMVASRVFIGRIPQMASNEVFLALWDIASIVALMVVVEMARRAFARAGRVAWATATAILLAVGGVVTAKWGPWPPVKTLLAVSQIAVLRLMQLCAHKAELLAQVLIVLLGLLVVFFGRRFNAGWHSHTQQLVIGLSTVAMAQLAVRIILEAISHTAIQSPAEHDRVIWLEGRLYSASNVIYLGALIWWIVCLWIDEPGTRVETTAAAKPSSGVTSASGELGTEENRENAPTEAKPARET